MHVLRSSGSEDDLVSSLVSVVEMLPTTFEPLSSTANEETPSSSRRAKASANGRSPLRLLISVNARIGEETYLIEIGLFEPILRSRRY